jgi:hypothetical protein
MVAFSARIANKSSSAVDNIVNYDIIPIINSLSGHKAQLVIIKIIHKQNKVIQIYFKRKLNKCTMVDFQLNLSYETWEPVLDGININRILTFFINTFHRTFYSSFPLIQVDNVGNNNSWITPGIVISC